MGAKRDAFHGFGHGSGYQHGPRDCEGYAYSDDGDLRVMKEEAGSRRKETSGLMMKRWCIRMLTYSIDERHRFEIPSLPHQEDRPAATPIFDKEVPAGLLHWREVEPAILVLALVFLGTGIQPRRRQATFRF